MTHVAPLNSIYLSSYIQISRNLNSERITILPAYYENHVQVALHILIYYSFFRGSTMIYTIIVLIHVFLQVPPINASHFRGGTLTWSVRMTSCHICLGIPMF